MSDDVLRKLVYDGRWFTARKVEWTDTARTRWGASDVPCSLNLKNELVIRLKDAGNVFPIGQPSKRAFYPPEVLRLNANEALVTISTFEREDGGRKVHHFD